MMRVSDLLPGESAVLPDGSVVTRRFNGDLRVRGAAEPEEPTGQPVEVDE